MAARRAPTPVDVAAPCRSSGGGGGEDGSERSLMRERGYTSVARPRHAHYCGTKQAPIVSKPGAGAAKGEPHRAGAVHCSSLALRSQTVVQQAV